MGTYANQKREIVGATFCFSCNLETGKIRLCKEAKARVGWDFKLVDVLVLDEDGGAEIFVFSKRATDARIRAERQLKRYLERQDRPDGVAA